MTDDGDEAGDELNILGSWERCLAGAENGHGVGDALQSNGHRTDEPGHVVRQQPRIPGSTLQAPSPTSADFTPGAFPDSMSSSRKSKSWTELWCRLWTCRGRAPRRARSWAESWRCGGRSEPWHRGDRVRSCGSRSSFNLHWVRSKEDPWRGGGPVRRRKRWNPSPP
jgi:hypothetical protein